MTDEYRHDATPSVLLETLIPSLVHQRIPKFRSLRKILSQYNNTPTYHSRGLSESSIDSITPPPSYRADSVISESADESQYLRNSRTAAYATGSFPFPPYSSPPTRPSSSASAMPTCLGESKSGIHWKYADPGFALLSLSSQEASSTNSSAARSSTLIRRQYIDGLCCMLRGLPSDLSTEEEVSIRDALPQSLALSMPGPPSLSVSDDMHAQQQDCALVGPSQKASLAYRGSSPPRNTALHRLVTTLTVYMILFISFLLPYCQFLLKQAYMLDRKHHISDRLVSQGIIAADSARRGTLRLAANFCAMNDGKVGDAVREIGMYAVQGFSAGVYDGVGEGMQMLGLRQGELVAAERKGIMLGSSLSMR